MKLPLILMVSLVVALPASTSFAADDKKIRAERQEAQKLRQQLKKERKQRIRDASKSFREFIRDLKKEYQEMARDLKTDFKLQLIDIKAEQDMKLADSEAEMQQNLTQLFLNPDQSNDEGALQQLKENMKTHSDRVFEIKKQAARTQHDASLANTLKIHRLMDERDAAALKMADDLGLRSKYEPILATAIGDGLTKQEEKQNAREKKDVEKLYIGNQHLFREFPIGNRLRQLEIENMRADFDLEWQKKSELHALNLEQSYYNSLLMHSSADGEFDQQAFAKKASELQKQTRKIDIKYRAIQQKNQVKREKQRKDIVKIK